ncbi:MAG: SpoIIE family protein phosphatase [Candidatus Riflebacteria bacterium]|nr:SpoIIE family protein phosphatase [Candidatus Riflebacteria bacterium]
MKTVFLDILTRAARVPSGQAWDMLLTDAIRTIPGFVALGVRALITLPVPDPSRPFIVCEPLSEADLRNLLDWSEPPATGWRAPTGKATRSLRDPAVWLAGLLDRLATPANPADPASPAGSGRSAPAARPPRGRQGTPATPTGEAQTPPHAGRKASPPTSPDPATPARDPDSLDPLPFLQRTWEGKAVTVLFAPLAWGGGNTGDLTLVMESLSPAGFAACSQFLDHLAGILGRRSEAPLLERATGSSSAAFLTFVQDTLHLLCQTRPTSFRRGRDALSLSNWLKEDADLLARFLAGLADQLQVGFTFAIQRFVEGQAQVVIVGTVDAEHEVHPAVLDLIGELFARDPALYGDLEHTPVTIRPIGRPLATGTPLLATDGEPTSRSFICQVGDEDYGHLGFVTTRPTDMRNLTRGLTLLANQLGFWFAHVYHLRQAQLKRDIEEKINMTLSVLPSSVNLAEIVNHLVRDLEMLFGQQAGAVLLTSRESQELEVFRVFGTVPAGFDLAAFVREPRLQESLGEGGVIQEPEGEGKPPIRVLFPLITTAQQGSLLADPLSQPQRRLLGGVILFHSPDNRPLTDDIRELLRYLVNGVSAALLVTLNYLEKLETIQALEGLMGKMSDQKALFSEMIGIIRRLLKVNRISFLTLTPDGQHLVIQDGYGLPPGVAESTRIPIGDEISGFVAREKVSLRLDNIEAAAHFHKCSLERYFNRSLLSVPLVRDRDGEKTVLGVINVNNKASGLTFTEQDQQLLEAIAHLVVAAIENVELQEEKQKGEKLQREFEMAREVQTRLLPKSFPDIPAAFLMSGRSEPARQIGGDLFDGLPLDDGRWLAAIGDVSGKGLPASLLMATTRILLRSAAHETSDPVQILARVSDQLSREIEDRFVTMQAVAIHPRTGEAEIVSAGHGPLLARLGGKLATIKAGKGFPLGLMEGQTYQATSFRMEPGDSFLMYTDGLSEEKSPGGEMFGVDRIATLFESHGTLAPGALVEKVFTTIGDWRSRKEAHDDLTVVALTYRGTPCP